MNNFVMYFFAILAVMLVIYSRTTLGEIRSRVFFTSFAFLFFALLTASIRSHSHSDEQVVASATPTPVELVASATPTPALPSPVASASPIPKQM
jgi:hypothetical protein